MRSSLRFCFGFSVIVSINNLLFFFALTEVGIAEKEDL